MEDLLIKLIVLGGWRNNIHDTLLLQSFAEDPACWRLILKVWPTKLCIKPTHLKQMT
jgi:hypothetical protein